MSKSTKLTKLINESTRKNRVTVINNSVSQTTTLVEIRAMNPTDWGIIQTQIALHLIAKGI